jgi:hypothetical protein
MKCEACGGSGKRGYPGGGFEKCAECAGHGEPGFMWEGIWITDPTVDETGRFPVDPLTYWKEQKS